MAKGRTVSLMSLSEGINDVLTDSEKKQIRNALINKGRSVAIALVCEIIETRTGLSTAVCTAVAHFVIKKIAKKIRDNVKV